MNNDTELYCFDCIHWEPGAIEIGFCSHEKAEEFERYAQSCGEAGAEINASDCPGFEEPIFLLPVEEGDRHE